MVIIWTIANHTVSSFKPQTPEDWDNLIRTYFDNSEAESFRRSLVLIQREMDSLDGRSPAVRLLDESAKIFPVDLTLGQRNSNSINYKFTAFAKLPSGLTETFNLSTVFSGRCL